MNDVVWWSVDNLKVTVILLSVFDDNVTVWYQNKERERQTERQRDRERDRERKYAQK